MSEATHRTATATGAVVRTAVVAAFLLLALRGTAALTLPWVSSAILSLLLSPSVEALQRRGMSAAAAAALVVFVPALLGVVVVVLAVPSVLVWTAGITSGVARLGQWLDPLAEHADAAGTSARWLAHGLRSINADAASWLARQTPPFALMAASVVMLTFFLLLAQRSLLAGTLRALGPRRARIRLLRSLRQARDGIVDYLLVMTLMNVALAAATAAVLWQLGIPGAPVWAAVIAMLLFIPYLGPLAVTLLLIAAPLPFSDSLLALAAPAVAFLLLHALEANVVSPWAMGHRLRIGRPALLAAVIVGGWTWGAVGGVLAVPLLIAGRAGLHGMSGHALVKAWLAGEDENAPSFAATSVAVLASTNENLFEPTPRSARYPTQNGALRRRTHAQERHDT